MLEKFTYLILLTVFLIMPTVVLYFKFQNKLRMYNRLLLYALSVVFIPFIWDYWAINLGVWYFINVTGINLFTVPVEEILLMIFWILFGAIVTLINIRGR